MKAGKSAIAPPLWVGFEGTSLPSEVSRWLAKGRIGGVVLYARNIESPAQVRALCRGIRSSAGRGNPLPLIAVDQEGGRVARFKEPPFTRFPPARACSLFCCRNETVAEAVGAATAAELRAVGIDIDFAPVLDVDSNPRNPVIGDRAFSDDPGAAATMGIAFAKGLLSRGILPVGKHFPGHGDTSAASHNELPVVRAGRGGGGGPCRSGGMRRRPRVPGGIGAGGGDRPAGPGDPRPPYVPADAGGGGGSIGAASGLGGVERTLSAGPAGGGGGTASSTFIPPAGGLGKYRANISGRYIR